jgi:hypothetical protein
MNEHFVAESSARISTITLICICSASTILQVSSAHGRKEAGAPSSNPSSVRDAQRDFDWDIGAWKMHMKRLAHRLAGSTTWVECDGTDTVRKIWDGRANLGEVEADCPAGHIELLTLRLYNPETRQWSLNITDSGSGVLSPPAVGEFKDGHGEFYEQEPINGKPILVRFTIDDITAKSARFEQAFSADWGKTWEVNLIVTETLMKEAAK